MKKYINQRKGSLRLKNWDYNTSGLYFVTLVIQNREKILCKIEEEKVILSELGKIVDEAWSNIQNYYDNVYIDEYVIMPDHLHGIISILSETQDIKLETPDINKPKYGQLSKIIKSFKEITVKSSKRYIYTKVRVEQCSTPTSNLSDQNLTDLNQIKWQRSYYDRIIRNENELSRIRKYIIENPLKWKLK